MVNEKCKICKEKVIKFKSLGFMEVGDRLYHFDCVSEYGYQKFCSEVIENQKKTDLKELDE